MVINKKLKYVLFFIYFVFFYADCYSIKLKECREKLYEVYKIDSINNYYLIYLKKDDKRYKVVSKMAFRIQAEKIELNKKYPFNLESIFNVDCYIDGVNINPVNLEKVDCINVDEVTSVCLEKNDSIYDLFKATNLDGLYLKTK